MAIMKDGLGASLMQIKFPHDAAEQIALVKVGLVQPYLIQVNAYAA
jgi:hypothetical protein